MAISITAGATIEQRMMKTGWKECPTSKANTKTKREKLNEREPGSSWKLRNSSLLYQRLDDKVRSPCRNNAQGPSYTCTVYAPDQAKNGNTAVSADCAAYRPGLATHLLLKGMRFASRGVCTRRSFDVVLRMQSDQSGLKSPARAGVDSDCLSIQPEHCD